MSICFNVNESLLNCEIFNTSFFAMYCKYCMQSAQFTTQIKTLKDFFSMFLFFSLSFFQNVKMFFFKSETEIIKQNINILCYAFGVYEDTECKNI